MKTCPECGSNNVIMFDSDNDYCESCKNWFPVADVDVEAVADKIQEDRLLDAYRFVFIKHFFKDKELLSAFETWQPDICKLISDDINIRG